MADIFALFHRSGTLCVVSLKQNIDVRDGRIALPASFNNFGEISFGLLALFAFNFFKGAVSYYTHMLLRITNLKALGQRFQV